MKKRVLLTGSARKAMMIGGLALTLIGASGCTQFRAHQGFIMDRTLSDSIVAGIDNRESVEKTLGRPTFVGQFDTQDWYYFARDTRQLAFASPRPVQQSVLHIQFDQAGNVTSVQRTGLENIARLSPEGDKTPTLGRHRTLLQDIFGNIGAVNGATGPGGGGGQQ